MKKLVISGNIDFSDDQRARLERLCQVKQTPVANTVEEWADTVKDADIIISDGSFLPDGLFELHNKLVTYPYIELGDFDTNKLRAQNVIVANGEGGNRDSIVEWTMAMTIELFRQFRPAVNTATDWPFQRHESLVGKKVTIVGHGNIGTQIGVLSAAFGMNVSFFNRGDTLTESVKEADLVINALNCNASSQNLLNAAFFQAQKPGSYFVSFVRPYTYDVDGLIAGLKSGIIAGAAIDCDPEKAGDTSNAFYQKLLAQPNVLVTPHVAALTNQAAANGREKLVTNIEAYVSGNPLKTLNKR
jgi:D-3-phosphoglycerate dehydrogenase